MITLSVAHPDFEQVADLFDAYRAHYGREPDPGRTRAWLAEQMARGLTITAASRGGRVCGFVTTLAMPASQLLGTFWAVRDLSVVPAHRRGGVARALLLHIVEEARVAGAVRVSLQTETDDAAALALYAALGFRPVTGLRQLSRETSADLRQ